MMRFIKRLFESETSDHDSSSAENVEPSAEPSTGQFGGVVSDQYFDSMTKMQTAISKNDYGNAAKLVRQNLGYIPGWVEETCRQYGSLLVSSIPSLQQGGTILALVGDEGGLVMMRETVFSTPELEPWIENIAQHEDSLRLFQAIQDAVMAHPNCLQTEVKSFVGESDGRRVANLISYLEKAGKIIRTRHGRTYKISSAGAAAAPRPKRKRIVGTHRTDKRPPRIREIDLSSLSYVPLPRAPLKWEEALLSRERARTPEPQDHFEVHAADWCIESVNSIPLGERPDTAFRQTHPADSGLLLIDDLGNAEGLGQIEAAALRYDRAGNEVVKAALQHGTYRIGVHPLGRGLIAMSRDCTVHAYDDDLNVILETALSRAPEILALRGRFDISEGELKNHIRCVAISHQADSYLFTAVDEAWCVDISGKGLWGAKLPIKEGWTRVATPSDDVQTSEEVDRSLTLMGLSLPIDPDLVKRRYRELAKEWHPDLNPSDDQSLGNMKALNLAAETLTGIEAQSLPGYTGATFIKDSEHQELEIGGLTFAMDMMVNERFASDWIYAASFAAYSDSVYLAGYSGRVVEIDESGQGVRAYDIGSVPRRIVDTGDYLYLLTDTRLYVLRENQLHALVDTFEGGDLVVPQTGFGLLESKRLRWFREDGHYLGSVLSKDPIRRVYSVDGRMIVETRTRRASVTGVGSFWE